VPFAEVLAAPVHPVDAVMRAWQGARILGEVALSSRKVVLTVHGHKHSPGEWRVAGVPALNVTARPDRGGSLVLRDV
jgi:hypothetical protein